MLPPGPVASTRAEVGACRGPQSITPGADALVVDPVLLALEELVVLQDRLSFALPWPPAAPAAPTPAPRAPRVPEPRLPA